MCNLMIVTAFVDLNVHAADWAKPMEQIRPSDDAAQTRDRFYAKTKELLKNMDHTSLEDVRKLIDSIINTADREDCSYYAQILFDMATPCIKAGRVDLAKEIIEKRETKFGYRPLGPEINDWKNLDNPDMKDFITKLEARAKPIDDFELKVSKLLKNINHTSLEDIEKLIDSIVDMENRKDYGHYISTMFDMVTSYIKAGRVDLAKEVIEETDKKLYHLPSDKILNIWNNQDIRDFAIGLRK